ncbi:hypothetical protein BKA61DRAFT_610287 [Leptodontidium sp. MPI-SDFR-AT-0119]|nr:hypothetical protein BKA61DRAFT_610287 [Leptodontidium sp. MPI-SDFR-AT-0119]
MGDTSTTSSNDERGALEKLGPEILIMVFENLCDSPPEFLQSLRLVSRSFNIFAIPVRYRTITLNSNLLDPNATDVDITWQRVRDHTRHVNINTMLDWDAVVQLLSGCNRLQSMRWSVWHDNPSELFPKTLKQAIHELWPNLRLTVDRIDCPYTRPPFHTTSFPALNLVEVLVDDRRVSSSTEPLQRLLVASKNLETLRIEFIRNPFTSHAGRLPPVRKLVLGFRLWDYTPEESVLIWDFSRLEALFIRWHTLLYLDPLVNKSGLTRLTRLVIAYDWPGRNFVIDEDAEYNAARTLILRRIIEQIPHHQLQELDIKCQLSGLPLTSIVCHGNTLRTLTLLDTSGFETDGVAPVTTSTADLQLLLNTCSRLVNLSIAVDFDGFHSGSCPSLDILAQFRNLTDLTLYSKCLLAVPLSDTTDVIQDSGYEILHYFCERKEGLSLRSLKFNLKGWDPFIGSSQWLGISEEDLVDPVRYPRLLLKFSWDHNGTAKCEEFQVPQLIGSYARERKFHLTW